MKTNKLKLKSLKVESFITNLKTEESNTVNGGKGTIIVESGAPGFTACLGNCWQTYGCGGPYSQLC
jgi:hypothetical protein